MGAGEGRRCGRSTLVWTVVVLLALWMEWAPPAHANSGLSLLVLSWPLAWLLLIVIIPIEGFAAGRILEMSFPRGCLLAARANLVSTAVGIPMAWMLPPLVGLPPGPVEVLLRSLGYSASAHNYVWAALALALDICLLAFLLSVGCEYLVARRYVTAHQQRRVGRWAWSANALSYTLVFALYAAFCYSQLPGELSMSWKHKCLSNLVQVGRSLRLYQQDHRGRLPEATDSAALARQLPDLPDATMLRCPATGKPYLFNAALSGVSSSSIQRPDEMPLLKDAAPHPSGEFCVLFVDGHVRAVRVTHDRTLKGSRVKSDN